MKPLTLQEVFDKVLEHSRQMTERSYDNTKFICVYRNTDGNKCFIGALIPDELYNEEMEGYRAGVLIDNFPELKQLLDAKDSESFAKLQLIHDSNFQFREEQLADFAEEHNLIYTEPSLLS